MRIKLIIAVVLALLCLQLSAGNVAVYQARNVAVNWLNENSNSVFDLADISEVEEIADGDSVYLFIVKFNPVGWVMVAATDKVEPVLGYSDDSQLNSDQRPVQLQGWIDGLKKQISFSSSDKYLPDQKIIQKWEASKDDVHPKVMLKSVGNAANVEPLLTCTWDQGKYYNEMAPEDANSTAGNGHVWIGCVATAMAQIMKYWEYPLSGMGANSYTHKDYGQISANFEEAVYEWSAMADKLSSGNTEVQEISFHAGVSINMDFDPIGSGSYVDDVPSALVKNFKYNNTVYNSWKDDWDYARWKKLLKDDLDNGRPILYAGYNATGKSGHAFVCDGYKDDFFHFNWGWAGYANGNFLLTALNPGNNDFTHEQSAILGIESVTKTEISTAYIQGFEQESAGDFSLVGVASIVSADMNSGAYSLRLSDPYINPTSINAATLTFDVPDDCMLNFWVRRFTSQVSTRNQQEVLIMPEYGQEALLTIFSGDFNDANWVNYKTDLSSFAGQTVKLMFIQKNSDYLRKQWMYVDDIVITSGSQNLAPFIPSGPSPYADEVEVSLTPVLKWKGGDPNGDAVTYNVYFGNSANPPLLGTITAPEFAPGKITHSEKYYWRVSSTDGLLESQGPVWSFTAKHIPPDMKVCGVSSVAARTANVCGAITDYNGATVSASGICWAEHALPTVTDSKVESSSGITSFSCDLTNLLPYHKYYYRSFTESNYGVGYSEVDSFYTLPDVPVVSATKVEDILRTSATIGGIVDTIYDAAILKRGVVWATNSGFDLLNSTSFEESGIWTTLDSFNVSVKGLPGPDTIYYRVFAENSVGRSFSNEFYFVTINTPPVIDLDFDKSTVAIANGFNGSVDEQSGGVICDDVYIVDIDQDSLIEAKIILNNQEDDEAEYLMFSGNRSNLNITGETTDTLILKSDVKLPPENWAEVLKGVELWVDLDAPGNKVRKVQVQVSDGLNSSSVVIASIIVSPINDAPVNTTKPKIDSTPEIGRTIKAVKGVWTDLLDDTDCEFNYSYKWQMLLGDEAIDLDGMTNSALLVDEQMCGNFVRLVEFVADGGCGGSDTVEASIEGDWYEVEKADQVIEFGSLSTLEFSLFPYLIPAVASSGLPVTYSLSKPIASISGDSLFMNTTGVAVITAVQDGNGCYNPSEKVYKVLTIGEGSQKIEYSNPEVLTFADNGYPLFAHSSAGLPLTVVSSDSSIAFFENEELIISGIGNVEFTFSQSGTAYISPAESVVVGLQIVKGDQVISLNLPDTIRYGDTQIELTPESNSGLEFEVFSSDLSRLEVVDDLLQVAGVGDVILSFSNEGNEFWNPVNVDFPVAIYKGIQALTSADTIWKNYGDPEFNIEVFSNSELANFDLEIADEGLAHLANDGKITVTGIGNTAVTISQSGTDLWMPQTKHVILVVNKGPQIINVPELPVLAYGDEMVDFSVTSNSGLELTIVSSDENIISISENQLEVKNVGSVSISITQGGNEFWEPAEPIFVDLVVHKANQTIETDLSQALFTSQEISFADFVTTSGLPVDEIISSDENIIEVKDGVITILDKGEVTLEVHQYGNDNYEPVSSSFEFVVQFPTGFDQLTELGVRFYPNPVQNKLYLEVEQDWKHVCNLKLINSKGQVFLTQNIENKLESINVSSISPGLYFLVIQIDEKIGARKLIIQ